jgi:hypothetical protein
MAPAGFTLFARLRWPDSIDASRNRSSRMNRMIAVRTVAAIAIVAAPFVALRSMRRVEPRLIGTWKSDAERTVEEIRRTRRLTEEQLGRTAALFGKLRVTYTPTHFTTHLDGMTATAPYEVLGCDPNSVVFRDLSPPRAPDLGLSAFTVIHFDGADAFWLDSELGGVREYFRRESP